MNTTEQGVLRNPDRYREVLGSFLDGVEAGKQC